MNVSLGFGVIGTSENPVELWDTFKREYPEAAKEYLGERQRSADGFASGKTVASTEPYHAGQELS